MEHMKSISKWTCGAIAGLAMTAAIAEEKPDYEVNLDKIPAAAEKKVDFVKEIKPLFEESCLKCHSGRRPKSRYSMETREKALKGGSSDFAAIVEKKSAESPLVWFVADAVEDQDLWMPVLDKREDYPKFEEEQVALIRAWIDQGAEWPEDVVLAPKED